MLEELLDRRATYAASAILKEIPLSLRSAASQEEEEMGTQKLCACDRTSRCMICADIINVDTVKHSIPTIVKKLSDVKKCGLWLNPFRGIPRGPRLSRFDVIYLDENCTVLAYLENFAEVEFEPLRSEAASALILPPHTLASARLQKGDQLRICNGDQVLSGVYGALPLEVLVRSSECVRDHMDQVAPTPETALPEPDKSHHLEIKPSLAMRVLRWLYPKRASTDRRRSDRIPSPQMIAYYWTGGASKGSVIGNVSQRGLYLFTEERWIPGTRLVMTIQKQNCDAENAANTSKVESTVVRWGEDGVGCEFVESGFVDLNTGQVKEGLQFERGEFDKFLATVRDARQ